MKPDGTTIAVPKTFQELARDIHLELNSSQKFKNWLLVYDDARAEDEDNYGEALKICEDYDLLTHLKEEKSAYQMHELTAEVLTAVLPATEKEKL
ncbi:MAG: hypothetical protein MRQ07_05455 [Candidatus Midichloria sp.]|nr:hypothetical protein [Candidatus Midichloria sp.]